MTALAVALVLVLVVTMVSLLEDAGARVAASETAELVGLSNAWAITLTGALQEEQLHGALLSPSSRAADRAAYEAAFKATDEAVAAFAGSWVVVRSRLSIDAGLPDHDGVLANLESLPEVRGALVSGDVDDAPELYGTPLSLLRDVVGEQPAAAGATELELRRTVSALLAGARGAVRQRYVGLQTIQGTVDGQEAATRLSIASADVSDRMQRAGQLVRRAGTGDQLAALVEGIASSPTSLEANELVQQLIAGDGPQPTTEVWVATVTAQVDQLMAAAQAVHAQMQTRAVDARIDARRTQRRVGAVFGVLLLLAVAGGVGSGFAARDRVRALADHRALVVGLLQWFQLRPLGLPGVEVASRFLAASDFAGAGGDFFDAFTNPDGDVVLAVGDVAGHDSMVVARMAEVRNKLRALAQEIQTGPADVMSALDAALEEGPLVTMLIAALRLRDDRLQVSRAGHVPAILRRADGSTEVLDSDADLLLGVAPDAPRDHIVTAFLPGDVLVLFTDGLIESTHIDVVQGVGALRDVAAAAPGDDLEAMADAMLAIRPSDVDDCALLLVRRSAPGDVT